jgi:hypothetical protein
MNSLQRSRTRFNSIADTDLLQHGGMDSSSVGVKPAAVT